MNMLARVNVALKMIVECQRLYHPTGEAPEEEVTSFYVKWQKPLIRDLEASL